MSRKLNNQLSIKAMKTYEKVNESKKQGKSNGIKALRHFHSYQEKTKGSKDKRYPLIEKAADLFVYKFNNSGRIKTKSELIELFYENYGHDYTPPLKDVLRFMPDSLYYLIFRTLPALKENEIITDNRLNELWLKKLEILAKYTMSKEEFDDCLDAIGNYGFDAGKELINIALPHIGNHL